MKITDEEIKKAAEARIADSPQRPHWANGAKWCRDRYENTAMTIQEAHQMFAEGKIKNGALKEVDLGKIDTSKQTVNDILREQSRQPGITHDEKLQEGKYVLDRMKQQHGNEIPWKTITEQAYDGSTINRTHEDPADWGGVDMGKLWNVSKPCLKFDNDNRRLRETAIKMSRDLNPNVVSSQCLGQYGSISTPPSIDKILTDAEKIYEWLIKG